MGAAGGDESGPLDGEEEEEGTMSSVDAAALWLWRRGVRCSSSSATSISEDIFLFCLRLESMPA